MQGILFNKKTVKQPDSREMSPADRYDIRIKASRMVYGEIDRQVDCAVQDIMKVLRKSMKTR